MGCGLGPATKQAPFGVEELIPPEQISTSVLERLSRKIRQRIAPLHREIRGFAKCRDDCSPSAVKIGPFTRLDEAGPVIWAPQLCVL
jgi:hypothetical protein